MFFAYDGMRQRVFLALELDWTRAAMEVVKYTYFKVLRYTSFWLKSSF